MLGLTPFQFLKRPLQVILVLNLAIFLVGLLGSMFRLPVLLDLVYTLALLPERYTEFWRLLTYAFVHVSPMHFIFNMLMFWMFGQEVADWLGEKTFTALYLFSGVFAALFSIPFYASGLMGNAVIIGASGALFGVMVAYARLFPDRVLLIFFVIPMRIKYAIWVFIAIDLLMVNSGDSIAHLTHLGGVLAGFAFMAAWHHGFRLPEFKNRKPQSGTQVLEGELGSFQVDVRLDAILAKISRSGMDSLSRDEIVYLQQASQRRRQRP
jgi:membrane associated rhomboid family serine protease